MGNTNVKYKTSYAVDFLQTKSKFSEISQPGNVAYI